MLLTRGRTLLARASSAPETLGSYTTKRLQMLCEASGYGDHTDHVTDTFRALVSPWAAQPLHQEGDWVSDIADDNTPIEFSVAIAGDQVEVRALFETQAEEPTLAAYREAGLAFQQRLADEFGASLERFDRIKDLFVPEGMEGGFAVWNAVVFSKDRAPQFKAYLNPQARGIENSAELVREGLERLGLKDTWKRLQEGPLRRGPYVDELKYFALDLMPGAESRVKVYVRHHDVTACDLEIAASAAETYQRGETQEFVRAMCGDTMLLHERAAFTCSSFVEGSQDRPKATTVYVPVCAYTRDDASVLERVCQYVQKVGGDPSLYQAIVRGFANRPLQSGVGMQPWIAFRRHGGIRLTSYLATEANHVYHPGTVPAPTARDSGVGPILRR